MKIRNCSLVVSLALGLLLATSPAHAAKLDDVMKKLEQLSATVEAQQKLLSQQAQEIERLKGEQGRQSQETAQTMAKVAEVEKKADKPLQLSSIKEVIGDRFSFSTDLRTRYEGLYDRQQGNTKVDDRNQFRLRWRLFGDFKATDELSLHAMLTTSNGSWYDNGTSSRNWQPGRTSNQTLDDEFNNKNIFIGRIYATYLPKWLPNLEVGAGKFKNTFLHTDIMWDPDVNPEGAYERYQYKGWGVVQPFVQLGQMVVAENNKTDDAYLMLYQAGADVNLAGGVKWTVAGSFYDWCNLERSDMSIIEGTSAGNTVGPDKKFLYGYKLVEGITFVEFKVANLPLKLWFDYILNTASEVPSGDDTAWSTGFLLGKTKQKGDWALYFKYAEIEPDAVIGAIADGDFYGANRKGYKVQGMYQLYDPWQLSLSWFQTDAMVGPENSENRLQADMIFKFSL